MVNGAWPILPALPIECRKRRRRAAGHTNIPTDRCRRLDKGDQLQSRRKASAILEDHFGQAIAELRAMRLRLHGGPGSGGTSGSDILHLAAPSAGRPFEISRRMGFGGGNAQGAGLASGNQARGRTGWSWDHIAGSQADGSQAGATAARSILIKTFENFPAAPGCSGPGVPGWLSHSQRTGLLTRKFTTFVALPAFIAFPSVPRLDSTPVTLGHGTGD